MLKTKYLFQAKDKILKRFDANKRPLDDEKDEPIPKIPKTPRKLGEIDISELTPKSVVHAQKLVLLCLLDQDELPEDLQEAVDILQNSEIKNLNSIEKVKLAKPKNSVLTTNMVHSSSFAPKAKKDMKVGTEHLEVDYFKLEAKNNHVKKNSKKTQTKRINKEVTDRAMSSDLKCRHFTAVPLLVMKQVHLALAGKYKPMEKLSNLDQLVFFYHFCKSNVTFNSLAVHYDLPAAYLSKAFDNMEEILFEHASKNIWWLSKEESFSTMPASMKENCPDHRATFDCFEVKTEVPSKVSQNILGYSNYKSGHTLKVLGVTSSCGLFQFMSKAYGGRATDSQIVVGSGVLNKIENKDVVYTDKGLSF